MCVPVITANHGGMGEYVQDGVNGLTFTHRDSIVYNNQCRRQ